MNRAVRALVGLVALSLIPFGAGVGIAQAKGGGSGDPIDYSQIPQPAVPPAKIVSAGMRITFDDYVYFGNQCTLGAVGTDSEGRKIGITAGHCNPVPDREVNKNNEKRLTDNSWKPYEGPGVQTYTPGNDHRVWDWRDVGAGPIGWIRWVSVDERNSATDPINKLDYMVIEFAPNVTLSSQVMTAPKYATNSDGSLNYGQVVEPAQPWFKMTEIYSDSAGNPTLPSFGETLCNAGSITNEGQVQGGTPTDLMCGLVLGVGNGRMRTAAPMKKGDSGGPAYIKGTGTKWVGISSWVVAALFGPHVYTSAKVILDDINSKPVATFPEFAGRGFVLTNN